MSAWTCRQRRARPPQRSFHLILESHDGRAAVPFRREARARERRRHCSGGKSEALDPNRPIREAVESLKRLTPTGRLEKRTLIDRAETSASGQKQTFCAAPQEVLEGRNAPAIFWTNSSNSSPTR